MTTVGILSDNHGDWPLHITESLVGVDAIIHAGDIGPYKLVLDMEAIAPTTVVLGNTDGDMPSRRNSLTPPAPSRISCMMRVDSSPP